MLLVSSVATASATGKLPGFDVVAGAAQSYLAKQPDYQNGDLIRRSQIEGVLKSVAAAGWKVDNAPALLELGVPDSSFLARALSTANGKKFMRKIAMQPGGYAHLDRLSTIPRGEQLVRDLIQQPGGDAMIAYLSTTKGGHKVGQMMGGVRGGVDLNKATGRVYTANDLVAVLQQLHQMATQR